MRPNAGFGSALNKTLGDVVGEGISTLSRTRAIFLRRHPTTHNTHSAIMAPLHLHLPNTEALDNLPAFTVGFTIFAVGFFGFYPRDSDAVVLEPHAPLNLNLNAISFYIFPHLNVLHLLLNLVALAPLLARYEKTHGTIYTGVTMNLLAVVAALQYCFLGLFLYPTQHVAGLLGEFFSFLTFYCYKEHFNRPSLHTFRVGGNEFPIPTLYFPLLYLCVIAFLFPNSSFFGHLAGVSAGYLLAAGKINFMFPPLKVIQWIELKINPVIDVLHNIVVWTKEEEAVNERTVGYKPLLSTDIEQAEATTATYEGFERRLGT